MSEPMAGDGVEYRDGKFYSEGTEITMSEARHLGWGGPSDAALAKLGEAETNMAARMRMTARILEHGMSDEATVKLVFDLKGAASHLDDLDALLKLVLDEMGAATNRDLACDGGVGDEEAKVWAKIEALAKDVRERKTKGSDPEPKIE